MGLAGTFAAILCAFFNVTSDINGFSELFRGLDVRVGIVSIAFWVPGYRDLALMGGVFDVSRQKTVKPFESRNWV